jgi:hypothetical protein
MKTKLIATLIALMAVSQAALSQNVNWKSLRQDQHNLLQLNVGYDYGFTTQLGYARTITMLRPAMVGLDFSIPMGNDLLDDFKVRLGGQIEVLEFNGFSVTVRIASVFRKYQSSLVSVVGFGSDFAIVTGYYAPTWSIGGEFGFDKAITTRFKHSAQMKAKFPDIKDGWYVPTGGHYYYGVQGGKTLGETLDLNLRIGATSAQFHDQNAMIPYYLQLGLGARF